MPLHSRGNAESDEAIRAAAEVIAGAGALLITAGAGMGVDSGLPDFRGPEGFWRAYPAYRQAGFSFMDMANAGQFLRDPALAWGFYGHRLALYRTTVPHAGFAILRRWAERAPGGGVVFTSNVDGQFQRADFDAECITEVHGSIHHAQCLRSCGVGVFPADGFELEVDPATMRAVGELPRCPACGALSRPNILMFGDGAWDHRRTAAQEACLTRWLGALGSGSLAVIELGAGSAIPTVRYFSEDAAERHGGRLVRINPREADVPPGGVGLPTGALAGLRAIDALLLDHFEKIAPVSKR